MPPLIVSAPYARVVVAALPLPMFNWLVVFNVPPVICRKPRVFAPPDTAMLGEVARVALNVPLLMIITAFPFAIVPMLNWLLGTVVVPPAIVSVGREASV